MRPFNFRSAWMVVMATAALLTGGPVAVSAQDQTVGTVRGVVTDENGAAMRGVQVVAQCSGTCDTTYRTATGVTDQNGRYEITIRGVGEFYVYASVPVDGIQVNLTPIPNAPFARPENVTRNLQIQYYPGEGLQYGVGGIVRFNQPVGDTSSIAGLQVTLTPQGSGNASTRVIRQTGDGLIVEGYKPGTYMVTARLNGATMLLAPHDTSNWATSFTGSFQTGTPNYTRHMWLDVRAAPPGTQSPVSNPPPVDTNVGPPGSRPGPEWGRPTDAPVDRRYFLLSRTVQTVGRWSVQPMTMWFRGSSAGSAPNTVQVSVMVTNNSPLPQSVPSSFRFRLNGQTTYASSRVEGGTSNSSDRNIPMVHSPTVPFGTSSRLASGQSAEVIVTFPIAQNEQTAVRSMSVTAIEQPVARLLGQPKEFGPIEITLPRRPANDQVPTTPTTTQGKTDAPTDQPPPPPPPSGTPSPQPSLPPPPPSAPTYAPPADPAPTPGAEAQMRALEGVYALTNFGELTLRYESGLLLGETRVRAGQPVMDRLKLAMPTPGRLQGVMQRTDQPPSRAWYTLDLTVSPDRARLQGQMGDVHPPINTPRAFTAQRSTPAPAATPAASATPTRIGPYDVVMVSARKTTEGDWESTWSLTNRSQETTRVNLNDVAVTLRAANGQTSTASGPYHYAGETGRRVRSSGFEIQPGEETKIRFWHSGSSRMTPTGYTFRAGASESAVGGPG